MVICHTDDHPAVRDRVRELGVRTVLDVEEDGYRIMQLHPGDTGGSFLEIDHQPGGEDPAGPWMPAGPDWQRARRTEVVDGIAGAWVQSRAPDLTAAKWSEITALDLDDGSLRLDNATVTFGEGPVDALVGVTLTATDPSRRGARLRICGVDFDLV
jgi:hypothetical protein